MDLVVVGARVRTLDPERPSASAVTVRDGVIAAVGDAAEARRAAAPGAEVLDAQGAALVPGLVDAHVHPFRGTDARRGIDLGAVRSVGELRAALAAERARVGAGGWVIGHGLHYDAFAARAPAAVLIDDVLDGVPAALRFFDLHAMLGSSRALELAGVDGPRRFAEAAEVVCDVAGRPTGLLREWAAIELLDAALPPLGADERLLRYATTLRAMNAAGLTGGHVMLGDPELLDVVAELEARGELTLRVRMPLWVRPGMGADILDGFAGHRDRGGRRWTAGVAKFFADGVIESGTAWLHEPDGDGRNVQPFWPEPGSYEAAVRRMAGHGFQCVTHCVGDRAVRAALDAYRGAGRAASGAPHRIEHLETLRDEELGRLAAEGVAASMQAAHLAGSDEPDVDDVWRRAVGEERLALGFRCADVRRSGAVLALGSDWIIASFDPRDGIAWARLRRAPGEPERQAFAPGQALSALEALEGYTTQAAAAAGESGVAGQIAPGFRGDLTLLAEDPVEVDADALRDVPVLATVVDGEVVHRA
jgi:predicted amidohydrolase YtcJ